MRPFPSESSSSSSFTGHLEWDAFVWVIECLRLPHPKTGLKPCIDIFESITLDASGQRLLQWFFTGKEKTVLRRHSEHLNFPTFSKTIKSIQARYGFLDGDLPALFIRHHHQPPHSVEGTEGRAVRILTCDAIKAKQLSDFANVAGLQICRPLEYGNGCEVYENEYYCWTPSKFSLLTCAKAVLSLKSHRKAAASTERSIPVASSSSAARTPLYGQSISKKQGGVTPPFRAIKITGAKHDILSARTLRIVKHVEEVTCQRIAHMTVEYGFDLMQAGKRNEREPVILYVKEIRFMSLESFDDGIGRPSGLLFHKRGTDIEERPSSSSTPSIDSHSHHQSKEKVNKKKLSNPIKQQKVFAERPVLQPFTDDDGLDSIRRERSPEATCSLASSSFSVCSSTTSSSSSASSSSSSIRSFKGLLAAVKQKQISPSQTNSRKFSLIDRYDKPRMKPASHKSPRFSLPDISRCRGDFCLSILSKYASNRHDHLAVETIPFKSILLARIEETVLQDDDYKQSLLVSCSSDLMMEEAKRRFASLLTCHSQLKLLELVQKGMSLTDTLGKEVCQLLSSVNTTESLQQTYHQKLAVIHPANYYRQMPVCLHCHDVYIALDILRSRFLAASSSRSSCFSSSSSHQHLIPENEPRMITSKNKKSGTAAATEAAAESHCGTSRRPVIPVTKASNSSTKEKKTNDKENREQSSKDNNKPASTTNTTTKKRKSKASKSKRRSKGDSNRKRLVKKEDSIALAVEEQEEKGIIDSSILVAADTPLPTELMLDIQREQDDEQQQQPSEEEEKNKTALPDNQSPIEFLLKVDKSVNVQAGVLFKPPTLRISEDTVAQKFRNFAKTLQGQKGGSNQQEVEGAARRRSGIDRECYVDIDGVGGTSVPMVTTKFHVDQVEVDRRFATFQETYHRV